MWLAPWLLALVGILLLEGPQQAAAAALPNCPGSPLILTEPDSEALDTLLAIWARYQSGSCDGRIVLAAPGIYRLVSSVSHSQAACFRLMVIVLTYIVIIAIDRTPI
jgi:hypothetical protein